MSSLRCGMAAQSIERTGDRRGDRPKRDIEAFGDFAIPQALRAKGQAAAVPFGKRLNDGSDSRALLGVRRGADRRRLWQRSL
jgi:hypothetical protein